MYCALFYVYFGPCIARKLAHAYRRPRPRRLDCVYLGDKDNRSKFNMLICERVAPRIPAAAFLDGAARESELRQILGDVHHAFDVGHDGLLIIGCASLLGVRAGGGRGSRLANWPLHHPLIRVRCCVCARACVVCPCVVRARGCCRRDGMLISGPNAIAYESMYIAYVALLSRDMFLRCAAPRTTEPRHLSCTIELPLTCRLSVSSLVSACIGCVPWVIFGTSIQEKCAFD